MTHQAVPQDFFRLGKSSTLMLVASSCTSSAVADLGQAHPPRAQQANYL